MVDRNLEHEGGEFLEISQITPQNRELFTEIAEREEKRKQEEIEVLRAKHQKEWLNPRNPFLWDGDFDD